MKKMKVLVIANQKGGVGKTAISLHLAWYLAEQKKKVLFVDLDTQGNASYTFRKYPVITPASKFLSTSDESLLDLRDFKFEDNIAMISADNKLADIQSFDITEVTENLISNINKIEDEKIFDYCIVDTPPSLGNALAASLYIADYVITPIELEVYSINGLAMMLKTINFVKRQNKNLKFMGMLPSKVDGRNPRHKAHLEQLKNQYNELILPFSIGLRSGIADALDTSIPVWQIKKTAARKAATEVTDVGAYILKNAI